MLKVIYINQCIHILKPHKVFHYFINSLYYAIVKIHLMHREEAFRTDPAQRLRDLCLKCLVSSATMTYLTSLEDKQRKFQ